MEKADISGKKRWCLSCIRVILTLLLGLKITISCIFGVLVYKDQSLENGKNNQLNLTQSSASMFMIRYQLLDRASVIRPSTNFIWSIILQNENDLRPIKTRSNEGQCKMYNSLHIH
ncbi:uncharacterized protein LOC143929840 [Lithobates pipiens]